MAQLSAADEVLASEGLCASILLSLKPADRCAIGAAACACRGLATGARLALAKLQELELPRDAPQGLAKACVAAFEARARPKVRVWTLGAHTFVLQLRRKDGRLLFMASAQPRVRERNLVDDILFSGAFARGFSADTTLFEKTDTATLYVLRPGAHGDTSVACLLADVTRQRKERSICDEFDFRDLDELEDARALARGNAAPSGEAAADADDDDDDDDEGYSSHSSDEPFSMNEHPTMAYYRQPEVTRFEPRTLFFVSPDKGHKALPGVPQPAYGHEMEGICYVDDAWCTLKCVIGGSDEASAAVSASLRFCTGPTCEEADLHGMPQNEAQLKKMLSSSKLDWRSCRR